MMKNRFLSLAGLALTLSLVGQNPLFSWWDEGHMVVARIAHDEMTPRAREKAEFYLLSSSRDFPNHRDMESASLWADDIVHEGIDAFQAWHGSARPYDPEHILSEREEALLNAGFENRDIVFAMKECVKTLKDPEATPWSKGFMLRMLVHIAGDIHQPCHCITLFSHQFPNGDIAGTRFRIVHEKYRSLHQLFDAAFGLTDHRPERPVTEMDRQIVSDLAKKLKLEYPREDLAELSEKSFDAWRKESYEIGKNFAYAGIRPDEAPSERYMEEGKKITGKQLSLAGYRLADLLNQVLD